MRNLNILTVAFFFFFAVSCSNESDSENAPTIPQDTTPKAGATYSYSADTPAFDVTDTIKTVTVNGIKGKNLYLAKYNMSNVYVLPDDIRVVSETTGFQNIAQNSSVRSVLDETSTSSNLTPKTLTDDVEQINPVAGTTTKDLYIPLFGMDGSPYKYFKMTFIARAVGEHCIVWAPAETQSTEAQTDQSNIPSAWSGKFPDKAAGTALFTDAIANELRDKFELAYPYETAMFGEKSTKMFANNKKGDKTMVDIKKVSDTAAYTNIVVYDFKDISKSSIYGYFLDSDYHPSYKTLYGTEWDRGKLAAEDDDSWHYYSNEGNYIYITLGEVIFDETRLAKKAWVEENEKTGPLACYPNGYLSLCHEYAHTLHFARKNIEQALSPPMILQETIAVLTEDALQNVLGVPKNYTVENYRIKQFCDEHYYNSVLNGSYDFNYSSLLAFGIFLTRNYGGAKLLSDIVTNDDKGSWSCVLKAIKNVTGIEKTEEQLMKEFLEQLLVADSKYTSNKASAPFSKNGITLTMPAINVRDFSEWYGYELATIKPGDEEYEYYQQVKKGVKTYDAKDIIRKPTTHGKKSYYIDSRGGFNLNFIGMAEEDSVTISFTDPAGILSIPKMMIVVGE